MHSARRGCWFGSAAAAALLAGCHGSQPPASAFDSTLPLAHRTAQAAYYTSLYSFSGPPDGARPVASVIVDGQFYGTTSVGGDKTKCRSGCGTVFRVSAQGDEKIIHRFKGSPDGANPQTGLAELNGVLYGTTYSGGKRACSGGCGVVYKIELGRERLIYAFKGGTDGAHPKGTLYAGNGVLYGTTYDGGADAEGTFFAVTPSGQENVLHNFSGGADDGAEPVGSMAAVSGALYGVTEKGGEFNAGTIFHMQPSGPEEMVDSFDPPTDGTMPTGLVNFPDSDTMYGTTEKGGTAGLGTLFYVLPDTAFRTIYNFQGQAKGDGAHPAAPPTVVDYQLYGTTRGGGASGNGTIYAMDVYSGGESVLYSFGKVPDGAHPVASLLESNGALYGTTTNGGSHGRGSGTVFSIEP
jgi:uncharacterized repeat protein (TIGR03803 family)